MEYIVHVEVTRKGTIEVEAGSVDEAIKLVNEGIYDIDTVEYDEDDGVTINVNEEFTHDDNDDDIDEDDIDMGDEDDGEGYY